jgi:hypothetical protein
MEGRESMDWPNNIPSDLRPRLEATLSQRGVGAAEVWGELVAWLRQHQVQPPAHRLPDGSTEDPAPLRFE